MRGRGRAVAWAAVLGIAAALAYGFLAHAPAPREPGVPLANDANGHKYLFANDTNDHKYDRALRASIRNFQEQTQVELGIVLKDALPPQESIEEYSTRLFKERGLGRQFSGKAILFLWSERERLFKIEVSYDLEPIFPDAVCRRLADGARTFMLAKSAFARRDFLTELIVTMGFHYLDYRKTGRLSELALPEAGSAYRLSEYFSGGAGVVGRGYAATVEQVRTELTPLSPLMAQEAQPDASAEEVARRYMRSLEQGVGDPQLPLLTEGSRYFRMEKPNASGYLRRIWAYYDKALPYRILEKNEQAAVVFQVGHPVLPILLRKNEQGMWLVDEASAWAQFHLFEFGENPVPKYRVMPFSFAWLESAHRGVVSPLFQDRAAAPSLLEFPFSLRELLMRFEREISNDPAEALNYLRMAELLHFEMYWLEAAAPLYERFLELAPTRNDIRWRLIDVYLNTTDVDGQQRQYLALLKRTPDDQYLRHLYYNWFLKAYGPA